MRAGRAVRKKRSRVGKDPIPCPHLFLVWLRVSLDQKVDAGGEKLNGTPASFGVVLYLSTGPK